MTFWQHNERVGWPSATHLFMERKLREFDKEMSKVVTEAMSELAAHLEDGKKIAYKTAAVNGMFTVSVRVEPGNPMVDRCFTIEEKWMPDKIGSEWVFKPSFFQTFSKAQQKTAEERTLRTLVANLSKNGVDVKSIDDQPDGKFILGLTNGSNFRLDKEWKPGYRADTNTWVFPFQLFAQYGPKPGSLATKSLFADKEELARILKRGRTPSAGTHTIPKPEDKMPIRISLAGNPVFADSKPVYSVLNEENVLARLSGFNMTPAELQNKSFPQSSVEDVQWILDTLTGKGKVKYWKESTDGRPAGVYTVVSSDTVPSFPVEIRRNCIPGTPDALKQLNDGQIVAVDFKTQGLGPKMSVAEVAKLTGKSEKLVRAAVFGDPEFGTKHKEQPPKHAYHTRDIPKGKAGEFSKITEEYLEALDAYEQGNKVMTLVELSDLLGAIERFLEVHLPGVSLDNIVTQAKLTNDVFRRGLRENRDPK